MPYQLEWKDDGVIFKFLGIVTSEDVINANMEIYYDDRLPKLKYQFCDFSTIEQFEITSETVRVVARLDEKAQG